VSGEGKTVGLEEVPALGAEMLAGRIQGRYVVDLSL
jgi:hypothetical protein